MCKFISFLKLKTIDDYKNDGAYKKTPPYPSSIKVCFIDDKGFDLNGFRKTGYSQVERYKAYAGPNQFSAFQIIACDIDGIGVDVDKTKQGLAVAKILKTTFPEKIVLVYSANDPFSYDQQFYETCDGFFPKSFSHSQIAEYLNKKAAIYWDPIAAWKWNENYLRQNSISNKTIAYMEDVYVRSLEKNVDLFTKPNIKDFFNSLGVVETGVALCSHFVELFIHL